MGAAPITISKSRSPSEPLELFAALILLYGAQCLKLLPAGCAMVDQLGRGRRLWEGGGWRVLSPLAVRAAYVGSRLPIVCAESGGLRARAPVSRLALAPEPGVGLPFVPRSVDTAEARGAAEARGKLVWVDGLPFARAISARQASRWAELLSDLAAADPPEVQSRLAAAVASSFDLCRFRARRADFSRATRALRWSVGAYLVSLFVILPTLALAFHAERGIALSLPLIATMHLTTLVSLWLAHRRLRLEARGERVELLIATALYPPALLHSSQELANEVYGEFHPAVLAAGLLDEGHRHRFLRTELARLMQLRDATPAETGIAELEIDALIGLAQSVGESESSLVAPPSRIDPLAERYCPACLAEYRAAIAVCSDCRVHLCAYGSG